MQDFGPRKTEVSEGFASDGIKSRPIVLSVKLKDLEGKIEFEPDWGWADNPSILAEEATWQNSLKTVGSISVCGDIGEIKELFKPE